ncbi:ESAT-6 protein secretion system EspG family protein [Tamaricihabitans halophyticus]|uniref:ESAT-6 protein secretion system EspG family protein n=1 Tax=Tamaricihabitans halophyticus TaxID=1262583 RepID=A0A4R2R3Q1_9PSEU|nr:ESX secretion-associated protein EspG [Tamaricihabitans halophyticus]TCP54161.1 ESAT-6 protein secretion system EspG family protein [Tamaricihabitans halophyticus]
MGASGNLVLSALEFDVLWESEGLPARHVVLELPSPGTTHAERAKLAAQAWDMLAERGLLHRGKVLPELADRLHLLARPRIGIDVWVWTDREIRALAAATGSDAEVCVVDGDEVWLVPARQSSLADAAVSVAGDVSPGVGCSVSVPFETLREADAEAEGDPHRLVHALQRRRMPTGEAQELAGMFLGMHTRGQFGVERITRDQQAHRAERVVAFHDTDAGRYLYLVAPDRSGRLWATVTPADNQLLATRLWELVREVS